MPTDRLHSSRMMKALALILMVAQLATLTTPILAAPPVSPDTEAPACGQVAVHASGGMGVVAEADCQGCKVADCHALHGCAGAAPALANHVSVALDLSSSLTESVDPISRYIASEYTPTSPPPRA